MPLPFEQLPRESNKAFAAFSLYLSLGPERSLAAVGQKLGKSLALMERWSSRYDWPARVQAYAARLAVVERETIEALAREKAVDWHKVHEAQKIAEWKLRTEYLELAQEGIRRWKAKPERCGSLEGLARLGEVFVKLGRLASGMPTEHVEHTGDNGGPIRVEFEVALKKIYGKAAGAVVEAEVVSEAPPVAPEQKQLSEPAKGAQST